MKFIFPQNYNFKNKLFGVIEYSTIFFFKFNMGFNNIYFCQFIS